MEERISVKLCVFCGLKRRQKSFQFLRIARGGGIDIVVEESIDVAAIGKPVFNAVGNVFKLFAGIRTAIAAIGAMKAHIDEIRAAIRFADSRTRHIVQAKCCLVMPRKCCRA